MTLALGPVALRPILSDGLPFSKISVYHPSKSWIKRQFACWFSFVRYIRCLWSHAGISYIWFTLLRAFYGSKTYLLRTKHSVPSTCQAYRRYWYHQSHRTSHVSFRRILFRYCKHPEIKHTHTHTKFQNKCNLFSMFLPCLNSPFFSSELQHTIRTH